VLIAVVRGDDDEVAERVFAAIARLSVCKIRVLTSKCEALRTALRFRTRVALAEVLDHGTAAAIPSSVRGDLEDALARARAWATKDDKKFAAESPSSLMHKAQSVLDQMDERAKALRAIGGAALVETVDALTDDALRCPVTLLPMRRPTFASDGHTYERSAILQILDPATTTSGDVSPMTREKLSPVIQPNRALADLMEAHHKSVGLIARTAHARIRTLEAQLAACERTLRRSGVKRRRCEDEDPNASVGQAVHDDAVKRDEGEDTAA
jgi:hypothetical protein